MKKNLTIVLAVLAIVAMAIPASAATLTYSGAFSAGFTHKFSGNEVFDPITLAAASKLTLNLTFKEGDKAVAYLPLTVQPFIGAFAPAVGNWYAAFASSPVAFWASNNASLNTYKFAALNDPMGIVASLSSGLVFNANGTAAGAKFNLYAADLGDVATTLTLVPAIPAVVDDPETPEDETAAAVPAVTQTVTLSKGNAFLGRVTYGLPMNFTLGVVGAYTNGVQSAAVVDEAAVISNANDRLTFGADITGKVPGLGATLTLAGAGSWNKTGAWDFVAPADNYAYMLNLKDINVGPVAAWAKYTAVGSGFNSYKASASTAILNKYAGKAAFEVEAAVDIPVGIPAKLTLGNGLWMVYPFELQRNETYGKLVVEPMAGLVATVSGAYSADLGLATDDGWKVHGDVAYTVVGLTINPYVDYLVDYYAESDPTDFVFGASIKGSPVTGLSLEADANYTFEEKLLVADAYALYVTEFNPGFVKSAKTTLAGAVNYELDLVADDTTFGWYAFAGSELGITSALTGKVGVLAKDLADGVVASATLGYKASDTVTAGLVYTYRQAPAATPVGWVPFADGGKNYLEASVTSTIGKSTFKVAYGASGLADGFSSTSGSFHYGKPWNYLVNRPTTAMAWDQLSFTVNVPF